MRSKKAWPIVFDDTVAVPLGMTTVALKDRLSNVETQLYARHLTQ